MQSEDMKEIALEMLNAGLDAVDPIYLTRKNIEIHDEYIKICDKVFYRSNFSEIVVLGFGKASEAMALGCEKLQLDDGIIITPKGKGKREISSKIVLREAEHPLPSIDNIKAADELLSKIEMKEEALFIILISGGGSALLTKPYKDITVEDIRELNHLLLTSGANIYEINTVRKHLSEVKGGRLAKKCREHGKVISLVLSDVVGDDLSVIASGPTYPDKTTFSDTFDVIDRYELWDKISEDIREHIIRGMDGEITETPKEVDADNFIIGNNMTALRAAKSVSEEKNFNTIILTSQNTGESREVAKSLMGIAKEVQDSNNPMEPPAALILGGETTVNLKDSEGYGKEGGPNRELVLSSAIEIKGRDSIVLLSVDSDGTDGIGKAGAIADTNSLDRSELVAEEILRTHESQRFFDDLGDSIELNSFTNVNDITIILVDRVDDGLS